MNTEVYRVKVGDVFFTVKKTVSMTYNPADPVDDFLKIGGEDMCVEYKYNKSNPTQVELQWLNTEGRKCVHGDMTIKGENTLLLFYLSIQILKLYTPVTHIQFIDNSKFPCVLPNKKIVKINLSHYYFLFHGKTWYHAKLGALPLDEGQRKLYESFYKNFDDPNKKPIKLDFKNEDLNKLFNSIWNTTRTWREFIGKIKGFPDICQKVYPWYYDAAIMITNMLDLPTAWCIDISRLKFSPILFERMTGGRPRLKKYVAETPAGLDYPVPSECRLIKYK